MLLRLEPECAIAGRQLPDQITEAQLVEHAHAVGLNRVGRERLIRKEGVAVQRDDLQAGSVQSQRERRARAAKPHHDAGDL